MNEEKNKQQIRVRYNETTAEYASQFLLNTTAEDVTINFSSGAIADPATGEAMLPVHTRIAMTVNGAKRLHQALGEALKQQAGQTKAIPASVQAKLPTIKQ